jgi:hypothetical protein
MDAVKRLIDYIVTNPEWVDTDAPILALAKAAAEELRPATKPPTSGTNANVGGGRA